MTNWGLLRIAQMKNDFNFGVEIEMNNITRWDAAKLAADYFGTNRFEDTHPRNGYCTYSAWDQTGREWKFQKDVSIAGDDAHKCELVTPILAWDDIETLQELCRRLRHAGAVSNPRVGAGIHIHVSRKDGFEVKHIRNLVNLMVAHEQQIGRAIHVDAGRANSYCRVTDPRFAQMIAAQKPKTMQELEDCWYVGTGCPTMRTHHYNRSRYHMLNLHSFFHGHGTVEFRMFQFANPHRDANGNMRRGGIHAGELKAYIQLCIALCNLAVEVRYATQKQPQCDNDKYAMAGWMCRMGMIGDEFATAREHLLKRLTGNAARRYVA